jgi:hypothetical protein
MPGQRKLARGLEDVSHLFLSSKPEPSAVQTATDEPSYARAPKRKETCASCINLVISELDKAFCPVKGRVAGENATEFDTGYGRFCDRFDPITSRNIMKIQTQFWKQNEGRLVEIEPERPEPKQSRRKDENNQREMETLNLDIGRLATLRYELETEIESVTTQLDELRSKKRELEARVG